MKIENIKGISDISGFGKNTLYEKACQDMLQAGFEWLEKNRAKKFNLKGHTYKGVYGIFEPDSKEVKELSEVICKTHFGITGAQHHAVMGHLFFIAKNGIKKWKSEIK